MAFLVCLGVAILIKADGRVVWVHDGECDLISLHKEREVDGAFLFGHGGRGLDGIFEKVRKYVGERAFDGGKALREGDLVAGADGEFFRFFEIDRDDGVDDRIQAVGVGGGTL